jgi:hypothetical protein
MPAPAHSHSLARRRGAELVARGAAHDEPPAAHARAREISDLPLYHELAAAHPRAGVHSRVSGDGQPAGRHARADELDAPQVTLYPHVLVAVARHREEVGELSLPVAVPDRERLDVRAPEAGDAVGAEALGLERHRRLLAEAERERHQSLRPGTSPRS